jgi:hypothetical protein
MTTPPRDSKKKKAKERYIDASRDSRRRGKSNYNALRHGLTTVSPGRPEFQEDVVELAKFMCGGDDDPHLFEKAAAVAEHDILIREVRRCRNRLLERLTDPQARPTGQARIERRDRIFLTDNALAKGQQVLEAHPDSDCPPEDRHNFNELLQEYWTVAGDRDPDDVYLLALPDLERLDRYERRAWSRRKGSFMEYAVHRTRSRRCADN